MQRTTDSAGSTRLVGFDIETECAVEGCHDKDCEHGLDFNRNRITVMALSDGDKLEKVFRGSHSYMVNQLSQFIMDNPDVRFTAHSGKFDFKNIIALGLTGILDLWTEDSCLLAFTHQDKIPDSWLADYNIKRVAANKLRTGHKHRDAGKHSLKTCAPFYLGVEPLWEPEAGHDDDEYVLKDARYCLHLTQYLHEILLKNHVKSLEFYYKHQLPWAKMLLKMELKGITIDLKEMADMWRITEQAMFDNEAEINSQWGTEFNEYKLLQEYEIGEKYHAMKLVAQTKGRWSDKIAARQQINIEKALAKIEPLNLDSPKQLLWLLRDRLGLDASNLTGNESTDAETLTRLAGQNKQVKVLLDYRKNKKLCSTYFPRYKLYAHNGRIHATFNPTTARTGRLSCSNPNLQQVTGALHRIFTADINHVLITRDLSAIEPTVLAYYSEDPVLCELLINGGDFHGTTAVEAFELDCDPKDVKKLFPVLRGVAKTVGLAVLYGAGANRVYQTLQEENLLTMTLTDAKRIVKRIRELYKGVWEFKLALDRELDTGAIIYNFMGRPMRIENREDVYMKGLNRLIQGSASDIMLDRTNQMQELGLATPLLLVHDEAVSQVPVDGAEVVEKVIVDLIADVKLMTSFGRIPIKTEGKLSHIWEK